MSHVETSPPRFYGHPWICACPFDPCPSFIPGDSPYSICWGTVLSSMSSTEGDYVEGIPSPPQKELRFPLFSLGASRRHPTRSPISSLSLPTQSFFQENGLLPPPPPPILARILPPEENVYPLSKRLSAPPPLVSSDLLKGHSPPP